MQEIAYAVLGLYFPSSGTNFMKLSELQSVGLFFVFPSSKKFIMCYCLFFLNLNVSALCPLYFTFCHIMIQETGFTSGDIP